MRWTASCYVLCIAVGFAAVSLREVSGACTAAQFKCEYKFNLDGSSSTNDVCIPTAYRLDGVIDCYDNSDERTDTVPCPLTKQITCIVDSGCQSLDERMDGVSVCGDDSDEVKRLNVRCIPAHTGHLCSNFVPNSSCINNICGCNTGFIESSRITCRKSRLLDPCTTTEDCSMFNTLSICDNSICRCDIPAVLLNVEFSTEKKCKIRELGDACTTHENCATPMFGTTCAPNNTCACASGYRLEDLKCIFRIILDRCEIHTDCSKAVEHSECSLGSCFCKPGFRAVPDRDKCYELALESQCSTSRECPEQMECDGKGVCSCAPGYHKELDKCVVPELSDECSSDLKCTLITNAVCSPVTNRCICKPGSYHQGQVCIIREYGDTCDPAEKDSCAGLGQGAGCDQTVRKCKCAKPWYKDKSGTSCLIRVLGTSCSTSADCAHLPGSTCIKQICGCTIGSKDTITCTQSHPTPQAVTTADPGVHGDPPTNPSTVVAVVVSTIVLLLIIIIIVAIILCLLKKLKNRSKEREQDYIRDNTLMMEMQPVQTSTLKVSSSEKEIPIDVRTDVASGNNTEVSRDAIGALGGSVFAPEAEVEDDGVLMIETPNIETQNILRRLPSIRTETTSMGHEPNKDSLITDISL